MTERIERWARGLGSLALLVGLVVGVPAALVVLGGDPLPARVDLRSVWSALLQPDDGTVLVRLLALVGWAAWVVFTLTVVVELVNLLRHRSGSLTLPGLGGVQQWAAGLMLTVVAIGAASQLTSPAPQPASVVQSGATPDRTSGASTDPSPATALPATEAVAAAERGRALRAASPTASTELPGGPHDADAARAGHDAAGPGVVIPTAEAPRGQRERVHVVVTGDDLWSLAERYYGRGQEWRRIAAANPERLTGGPDRLRTGWRLVIPDARPDGRPNIAEGDAEGDDEGTVRVRRGDTLSSIAERRLGDAERWPEIFRANRDQLPDPDDLPVGLVLRLPDAESDTEAGSLPSDPGTSAGSPDASSEPGSDSAPTAPSPGRPGERSPAAEPSPPAPSRAAATPSATATASAPTSTSTDTSPTQTAEGGAVDETGDDGGADLLLPGLVTVGGLLAAALTGGLAARRRWQLHRRPVGRRVAQPPSSTAPVEVALARRARPIGLRTLDRASRAVAAAAVEAGLPVPALRSAAVSAEWLVLGLEGPLPPAPRCFVDTGDAWCLAADAVDGLRDVPGIGDARRPWPLLVGVGTDEEGADRVVDLESTGLLAVTGDPGLVTAALAATALELACSPWTEELGLTLVGDERLGVALAQHNVGSEADLDVVLARLERLAGTRREHADRRTARDLRVDPDRAEAWAPEVLVVDAPLAAGQAERLLRLTRDPAAAISAVVRGPVRGEVATLALEAADRATLQPEGLRLVPQVLAGSELDAVVDLVRTTGNEETTPASWWSSDDPPEAPPDNVTYLEERRRTDERDEQERRAAVQARMTEVAGGTVRHPLLQLLGPVELLGAAGAPPPKAARQCLEYCAWLLENPGSTAQAMAAGLLVAEGTRRSNMSRLRTWLGAGDDGEPYLPDAYSGRIWLDPLVSSDWHQLQLLVGDGVDRAPTSVLELGLRLVRGAPLADAAPVQWHWAESLRTDMISCVRDIAVELSRRALGERDLDLARWSAARGLAAAPGDELLMRARLRTEHLAGNTAETERLSLQIAQHARMLGADLEPATVDLIQEVMEGRIRARLA